MTVIVDPIVHVGELIAVTEVEAPTFNGNALTATALATARTIFGQSFNGTANVSGAITGATAITTTGLMRSADVTVDATGVVNWSGRSEFQSPSDGVIVAYNAARTAFTRFNLGGTTSSFPSIKRSGAGIEFRLADDSASCDITAAAITGQGLSTAAYPLTLSGAGMSSALNEIHTFPAISGGLIYLRLATGDAGLFILNSASSVGVIYGDTTNVFSLTPSAASKVSVYMSAGALKVENKYGATTITGYVIKG